MKGDNPINQITWNQNQFFDIRNIFSILPKPTTTVLITFFNSLESQNLGEKIFHIKM